MLKRLGVVSLKRRRLSALFLIIGLFIPCASAGASILYYDPSLPDGSNWLGDRSWSATGFEGPYNRNWADSDAAWFKSAERRTVLLSGNSLHFGPEGGLFSGGGLLAIKSSTHEIAELRFSDSFVNAGAVRNDTIHIAGEIRVRGLFTLKEGVLVLDTDRAMEGRVSVGENAFLRIKKHTSIGEDTSVVLNPGWLQLMVQGEYRLGKIDFQGNGILEIGTAEEAAPVIASIDKIGGDSGHIRARNNIKTSGVVNTLFFNVSEDNAYGGNIEGARKDLKRGTTSYLRITKQGAGDLTLSGSVSDLPKLVIKAGGLFLSGKKLKSFNSIEGEGAAVIIVSDGGTIGGNGSPMIIGEKQIVRVDAGGAIHTGLPGVPGVVSFQLGQDSCLDLAAAAGGDRWLRYELGASSSPGLSHGMVRVAGGSIRIGDGKMRFADFDLTPISGFGTGEYVLLEGSSGATISGRLASAEALTGLIGEYKGSVRLDGSQILLEVTR